MDAGRLDVLEHRGDPGVLAVAERVDVELERAFEIAVDEARPLDAELVGRVRDVHAAAADHVVRADEHRVADPVGDLARLLGVLRDAPLGREVAGELREAAAVLGGVDRVERVAEQRHAGRRERRREPERRLPAERDGDAERAARARRRRARSARRAARGRAGRRCRSRSRPSRGSS